MQNGNKTALLSAYNKDCLADFARALYERRWYLLASSGTAKFVRELGLPCADVADMVGKPILGHKVVTLSREVHAGLLANDTPEEQRELDRIGAPRIDLVYVNLYPLKEEIERPGHTLASVLEKTDIGGPTILRAGAKGRRIVLCRPMQFQSALMHIDAGCPKDERYLSRLAAMAENMVAEYAFASANFHAQIGTGGSPI